MFLEGREHRWEQFIEAILNINKRGVKHENSAGLAVKDPTKFSGTRLDLNLDTTRVVREKEGAIRRTARSRCTIDPEMRIRFTSPHPKDFPDDVLNVIRDRLNVRVHMPAQSGSTATLERMRRGYSREAYLDLVNHVKKSFRTADNNRHHI